MLAQEGILLDGAAFKDAYVFENEAHQYTVQFWRM
jgi:hypothetical protein